MYCNNTNCTKTHCANHYSNHSEYESCRNMNENDAFKCPSYETKFKGSASKPSLELFEKDGETMIREYTIDQQNGKKQVLNVYKRKTERKYINYHNRY